MSDNFVFRHIIDPFFAPSKIMDEFGSHAHANTPLSKTLTRPDVIAPLLGSVSAIAVSAYFSSPAETLNIAKDIAAGALLMTGINISGEKLLNKKSNKTQESAYFVDRTRKNLNEVTPGIEARLRNTHRLQTRKTLTRSLIGAFATTAIPDPMVIAATGTFVYQSAHKLWGTHRILTKEWNIHTDCPDTAAAPAKPLKRLAPAPV